MITRVKPQSYWKDRRETKTKTNRFVQPSNIDPIQDSQVRIENDLVPSDHQN